MNITVRLLASYRQYLPEGHDPEGNYPLDVPSGARVAEVLAHLPVPQGETCTFLVNGRHAARDRALEAGDVLTVFPAAGGG